MLIFQNYRFRDDVKYGTRHPYHEIHTRRPITLTPPGIIHPDSFDLSDRVTSIYNQGSIGACVSNAVGAAIKMKLKSINKSRINPFRAYYDSVNFSRLYNYNLSRLYEKSKLSDDCGCMVESALEILDTYSFCDESLFDYTQENFSRFPDLKASVNASVNGKPEYKFKFNKLQQDLETIKSSIVSGNPVFMGIVLFDSMNREVNGLLPTPNLDTDKVISGHCILLDGYDDNKKTFKFVNCWGDKWGNNGFGYIMYDYAMNENIAGDIYNII